MNRAKPYHHGNLREALLRAAIRLIAEVGPTAFTLREVARRAGVSHNAPYRHFRDKNDLMTAVATEGYRELTEAMERAARGQNRAIDRLKYAGLAYIEFALRRPEHFTVMFDAPLLGPTHQESNEAAKRIALSIANSPLVKTAIAGSDPNWGRILSAAGNSGVNFDPTQVDITLQDVKVCRNGLASPFDEADMKIRLDDTDVSIVFRIAGKGKGSATFWTCDLTEDYIHINASYRS